eukprot:scaffold224384_cov21-Prasinocladus_malaysianus.AAC.1
MSLTSGWLTGARRMNPDAEDQDWWRDPRLVRDKALMSHKLPLAGQGDRSRMDPQAGMDHIRGD